MASLRRSEGRATRLRSAGGPPQQQRAQEPGLPALERGPGHPGGGARREKLGRRSWTVHPVQQLLCVLMPLVSMNQQSAKTKEEEGLL
ncbi:hypothetical protein PVAP13_2KG157958 [Panicum virgatum]|uniref:Uncharacterized protein n=1 Tax=Panicum virgatum TaxID=38727 RepID=A0A8T0VYV8_PANVG|nr:hypothetical protein PVAP13_2KG157958 [Panicum virgatum]